MEGTVVARFVRSIGEKEPYIPSPMTKTWRINEVYHESHVGMGFWPHPGAVDVTGAPRQGTPGNWIYHVLTEFVQTLSCCACCGFEARWLSCGSGPPTWNQERWPYTSMVLWAEFNHPMAFSGLQFACHPHSVNSKPLRLWRHDVAAMSAIMADPNFNDS